MVNIGKRTRLNVDLAIKTLAWFDRSIKALEEDYPPELLDAHHASLSKSFEMSAEYLGKALRRYNRDAGVKANKSVNLKKVVIAAQLAGMVTPDEALSMMQVMNDRYKLLNLEDFDELYVMSPRLPTYYPVMKMVVDRLCKRCGVETRSGE